MTSPPAILLRTYGNAVYLRRLTIIVDLIDILLDHFVGDVFLKNYDELWSAVIRVNLSKVKAHTLHWIDGAPRSRAKSISKARYK